MTALAFYVAPPPHRDVHIRHHASFLPRARKLAGVDAISPNYVHNLCDERRRRFAKRDGGDQGSMIECRHSPICHTGRITRVIAMLRSALSLNYASAYYRGLSRFYQAPVSVL